MKTRKLLLALQKRNQARLTELRTKLEKGEVREEDLETVQAEVDELAEEAQDIADELANLDDEKDEEEEKEEEEKDDEEDEDEEGDEEEERGKGISPEKRDGIMKQIGKGLSSKGHKSAQKRSKEIRSAFAKFVVGKIGEEEARSLGIVSGNGSVIVPEVIANEVITYAQEENMLRKYGSYHPTKGIAGYPVLVKQAEANVNKKERTTDIPETDIELDEILLDPAEFDALATVSKKLLNMSDHNVEDIVITELKKAYVRKEINYMFKGNDVDNENPGSLEKKSVAYYESTAVGEDDQKLYKELVKLKGQPVTEVLKKSMWIVNRAALTRLEGMTDLNGRPLLHEATDGIGYKLLGHPLDFTDAADGADSTKPVFYFGDFEAFHIQEVMGSMQLQKLVEKFSSQNKVGFQIYNILDGQLVYSPFEPAVYRYEVGATDPNAGA